MSAAESACELGVIGDDPVAIEAQDDVNSPRSACVGDGGCARAGVILVGFDHSKGWHVDPGHGESGSGNAFLHEAESEYGHRIRHRA